MHVLLLSLVLLAPPDRDALKVPVMETMSLLGDTLVTPEMSEEDFRSREFKYLKALRRYDKKPDVENLIWLGRRLGYLGRFRDAIDLYTQGIESWPQDARLYRHRGHRWISVREFEKAIGDFEQAVELMPDSLLVEPDGLPNQSGTATTTLQFNVWYHLGLAYYLHGDYTSAGAAFQNCLAVSNNNDCQVSVRYWIHFNNHRLGTDSADALEPIVPDMYLLENEIYHRLILVHRGMMPPDSIQVDDWGSLNGSTSGYGLAMWYELAGDREKANQLKHQILGRRQWSAFGSIAAEADLARELKASDR